MKQMKRLQAKQLRKYLDETVLDFTTTDEVSPLSGVIGQSRGTKVMQFGLQVNKPGYHIYVAGLAGTGKTSFTKTIVDEVAQKDADLSDWCYVNNFTDRSKPKVLQLPPGTGRQLKNSMEQLIRDLKTDIPKAFNDENYQKEKQAIIRTFNQRSGEIFQVLNEIALEHGFIIRPSGSGMLTVPAVNGEPMSEEAYRSLPEEKIHAFNEENERLQGKILNYTKELRELEKETKQFVKDLDEKVAHAAVRYHLDDLQEQFAHCSNVLDYLQEVQTEIVKHKQDFFIDEQTEQANDKQRVQDANQLKQMGQHLFTKYEVNLFIDHEHTNGAPVVVADNPTFYHLVGRVEYENQMGMMRTDFTKIKPGFLHEANGGYLIIQAKDILANRFAWESLKRSLLNERITIENIAEQTSPIATATVTPDPIPLTIKVIIIGSLDIYQLLYYQDEDFRKLFKIKADFNIEMHANLENMTNLARFIHTHCKRHNLLAFHRSAVARIIAYSTRLAGHQEKLSTRFNEQVDIIYEAHTWAMIDKAKVVMADHVEQAIHEKNYRNSLYEEKFKQNLDDETILIDTSQYVTGQVNGLAVYQLGQYSFGKPIKITANTFAGKSGIINIERESEMSGKIHNKGIYILAGYLGEQFAQNHPLTLTAHVAFEQSYGPVDGDSASSTELYAILSSLAHAPIYQGIAVTGSVNQKGEIQAIGGVNEKIEGFFKVCKSRGLTGDQGVIIPQQNIQHLMLDEEVVDAVKANQFHIYAIESIVEGIEILTGVPAGLTTDKGHYKQASIYGKIADRLQLYANDAKDRK